MIILLLFSKIKARHFLFKPLRVGGGLDLIQLEAIIFSPERLNK
jgi:hypothetical protein